MSKTTRLAILGVLAEGEKHGYEIHQTISSRMGDYTDLKVGSIYHALGRFAEQGLVEQVRIERQSGGPDRRVFCITGAGRQSLQTLLKEELVHGHRLVDPISVALTFINHLPQGDAVALLTERLELFKTQEARLFTHRTEVMGRPQIPRFASLIFDLAIRRIKSEIQWMEESIFRLEIEPDLLQHPRHASGPRRGKDQG